MTRAFRQFIDAVLPTSCISCHALGSHICKACSAAFAFAGQPVSRQDFHGCTATELNRAAHLLISAVKDDGRTGLLQEIARAVVSSLDSAGMPTGEVAFESQFVEALKLRRFSIVAVPTSKAALKRRGFDPAAKLAKLVATELGVPVQTGLRLVRETRDQRALTLGQRAENLRGAMRYRSEVASSIPVMLLDDVVTTGATLLEARRAIETAGIPVVGFATFAETPSLRDAKEQK